MKIRSQCICISALFFISLCAASVAAEDESDDIRKAITAFYSSFHLDADGNHRLDEFEQMWHSEARIHSATADGSLRTQSFDEFMTSIYQSIEAGAFAGRGFREDIEIVHIIVRGDFAQATVFYRLFIPATAPEPRATGMDMIQLVKADGQWLAINLLSQRDASPQ